MTLIKEEKLGGRELKHEDTLGGVVLLPSEEPLKRLLVKLIQIWLCCRKLSGNRLIDPLSPVFGDQGSKSGFCFHLLGDQVVFLLFGTLEVLRLRNHWWVIFPFQFWLNLKEIGGSQGCMDRQKGSSGKTFGMSWPDLRKFVV